MMKERVEIGMSILSLTHSLPIQKKTEDVHKKIEFHFLDREFHLFCNVVFTYVYLGPMLPSKSTHWAAALHVKMLSCTKSLCFKCAFVIFVWKSRENYSGVLGSEKSWLFAIFFAKPSHILPGRLPQMMQANSYRWRKWLLTSLFERFIYLLHMDYICMEYICGVKVECINVHCV